MFQLCTSIIIHRCSSQLRMFKRMLTARSEIKSTRRMRTRVPFVSDWCGASTSSSAPFLGCMILRMFVTEHWRTHTPNVYANNAPFIAVSLGLWASRSVEKWSCHAEAPLSCTRTPKAVQQPPNRKRNRCANWLDDNDVVEWCWCYVKDVVCRSIP